MTDAMNLSHGPDRAKAPSRDSKGGLPRRRGDHLRAAIFDWAGTVVDFGSRAPVAAVMQAFRTLDVPVSAAEARESMGMTKQDHLRSLLGLPRIRAEWQRVHHEDSANEIALQRLYATFLPIQEHVLLQYSHLIPGCLETMKHCRARGMRLGSSTGYTGELMQRLSPAARQAGLEFDALVCGDEVPEGRPAPWMCLENAQRLGVYPLADIVVVDDTIVGIQAGLNAGMWTIGVAKSGNLVGLSEDELAALSPADRQSRIEPAYAQLQAAGAHCVIGTVEELPSALDTIDALIAAGDAP